MNRPVDLQQLAAQKQVQEAQKLSNMYSLAANLVSEGFSAVIEEKISPRDLTRTALLQARDFFQVIEEDAQRIQKEKDNGPKIHSGE